MQKISAYITEKLRITKNENGAYTLFPKDIDELVKMIKKEVRKNGWECDLNHIDVSKITDMRFLFSCIKSGYGYNLQKFNGDISNWDVSNVTNMESMFKGSAFSGDISKWDVRNVERMHEMFMQPPTSARVQLSHFNCDISNWKLNSLKNCRYMFWGHCYFFKDLTKWNLDPNKVTYFGMFERASNNKLPKWYKQ